MVIDNPISTKARGVIYVLGIVIGACATIAGATLGVLGLNEWAPVVAVAAGAIGTLTATLSRANLGDPVNVTLDDIIVTDDGPKRGIDDTEEAD